MTPVRSPPGRLPTDRRVEDLRYSIEVFDAVGNPLEVLGRLADLEPARAAFAAAVAKYPGKRIFLCVAGRVIARSDGPA